MRYIFLLILIVPAAEIALLLLSGNTIGIWPTLGIILFTGVLGAYLAKREGLEVIRRAQNQLSYGQVPGEAILDGICVLAGGIFLLTPGFITDVSGLLLLAAPTRRFFKTMLIKVLRNRIDSGNIKIIR